jgi:hypothetical protein
MIREERGGSIKEIQRKHPLILPPLQRIVHALIVVNVVHKSNPPPRRAVVDSVLLTFVHTVAIQQ